MGIQRKEVLTVKYRDITLPLARLAEISGTHWSTLRARIRCGWDVEAAAIALPEEMVRSATSHHWLTKPENKKRADDLYKKIVAQTRQRKIKSLKELKQFKVNPETQTPQFTKQQLMRMLLNMLENE